MNKERKIKFPKDNSYPFAQDFARWKNIPDDVEFAIGEIINGRYVLTAPGYGMKDNYGNGAIFVDHRIVDFILLGQVGEVKGKYSGEESKEFWDAVNAIRNEANRQELHSLGVALQNHEEYVLHVLNRYLKED
jgi:hypothetical protein